MPLDDLVSVIETLQQRIRDHGDTLRQNEYRTRMALIDPLLTALGWDVSDPELVMPEYDVSGRKADYALLSAQGRPAATIEAKRLGESLESHRMQMLNYSNASGVEYSGLTDGNRWELYEVFKRGQLEDRRILDVTISREPSHRCALEFLLLWWPNLASGEPVAASEPLFQQRPETVEPLVPAEQGNSALGVSPESTSDLYQSPSSGWVPLAEYWPPARTPHPEAMRLPDSTERPITKWSDIWVLTVEWLVSVRLLTEDDLPFQTASTGRNLVNTEPVHPDGSRFTHFQVILGGHLAVNTNLNGAHFRRATRRLLTHCGQDPASVWLKVD